MRRILAILAVLFSVSASAALPTNGLGYRITSCFYDIYGVDVSFDTTNEPPYVVGIFLAEEAGYFTRYCPIRVKLVNEKVAHLSGRFYDRGNVFVQVLSPSATNDPMFRVMSETDVQRYYDDLRVRVDHSSVLETSVDCWDERTTAGDAVVIDDFKWGAFYPSSDRYFTFGYVGHRSVVDVPEIRPGCLLVKDGSGREFQMATKYSRENNTDPYIITPPEFIHFNDIFLWREVTGTGVLDFVEHRDGLRCAYNPCFPQEVGNHEFKRVEFTHPEETFGPFDTSVGCGYRVIWMEKEDDFIVERANSLYADRSNEVVLRKPLKPMSAHDGKKVVLDWLGFVRMAVETNATPDRIYWEGL